MEFVAEIKLSEKAKKVEKLNVTVNKTMKEMVFDDVYEKIDEKMEEEYPESDFPNARIGDIFVIEKGNIYPVCGDSKDEMSRMRKSIKKNGKYEKFMVLPWARYKLTEECKLFMKMGEEGLLKDKDDFDFEKYHKILEEMKK